MSSFSNQKRLRIRATLGEGEFSAGGNQITFEGFRSTVEIDKAGFLQAGEAKVKIYGVSQSDMNSCTTLTFQDAGVLLKNTLEIWAIDGADETLVFVGHIVNAWADYQGMPDVFLHIQARTNYWYSVVPCPPLSFQGEHDASEIFSQLAKNMGLTFEGNGFTFKLRDQYLKGTAGDQLKALVAACGCDVYQDDRILAITKKGQPRDVQIPLLSRSTGLVGYPTFDGVGINVVTLFHPGVTFGGEFKLETDIPQAAGQWKVASVAHHLEANKPNGAWFSMIRSNRIGIVK